MSKDALAKVVQRAISDAGFRRQLNSDPTGALRGFDLSADELSALRAGDAGRLSTLGIDQRMSKAFAIGGALASTRMSVSDVTSSRPSMVDDVSGAGARTVIPSDPGATLTADDGGVSGSRAAGASTARVGDDWKFADRAASQGAVAPVEGSPEATAANFSKGDSMAAYPAHDGLAGPSQVTSARAGDDWARSNAGIADASRAGAARLDDTSGASTGPRAIRDDPDGFLANQAKAAEATSGQPSATRDAFVDESSEGYLTKVGYDPSATGSEVTDAHDRTFSGENVVGPEDSGDAVGGGGPHQQ